MATSVYDWMMAQKRRPSATDEGALARNDDVLVRILKVIDARAIKAPVSST